MKSSSAIAKLEPAILSRLERLPLISAYSRSRGWPFVLSWCHRISGLLLSAFILLHLYTLTGLVDPQRFQAEMNIFRFVVFAVFQWILAIPVIFHALNGGRLIMYESFGCRADETMIRAVMSLSVLYLVVLGILMLAGNQSATPLFFWLVVLAAALSAVYCVFRQVWGTSHHILWKLQRLTAAYMLVMIPAHLLFMHLNFSMGHDARTVLLRMQSGFMKGVDVSLIASLLYHAGYGIFNVISDYAGSRSLRAAVGTLLVLGMSVLAWIGIRLTITL